MEDLNNQFSRTELVEWTNNPITQAIAKSCIDERDRLLNQTMVTESGKRDRLVDAAIGIDFMLAEMLKYGRTPEELEDVDE